MVLEDHGVVLLVGVALCAALSIIISFVIAVKLRGEREGMEVDFHSQPPVPAGSNGVLAGGMERYLSGADPVGQSSGERLRRWLQLNGSDMSFADSQDALADIWKAWPIDWLIFGPPQHHLDELFFSQDADFGLLSQETSSAVVMETEAWIQAATALGIKRQAILSYYDPLAASELTAPEEQKRMSLVIQCLNEALRETSDRYGIKFIELDRFLGGRSGEFTRIPLGVPYLNNVGHTVQLGLLKAWILDKQEFLEAPADAEAAHHFAVGLGRPLVTTTGSGT